MQCVNDAKKYNYTGYNLDWEPTDGVTEEDGVRYAQFIDVRFVHSSSLSY